MLVFKERDNQRTWRKTSWIRDERTNNKHKQHIASAPGVSTWSTSVVKVATLAKPKSNLKVQKTLYRYLWKTGVYTWNQQRMSIFHRTDINYHEMVIII